MPWLVEQRPRESELRTEAQQGTWPLGAVAHGPGGLPREPLRVRGAGMGPWGPCSEGRGHLTLTSKEGQGE